jgi:16S rRNA (guanine966-N2)-methyltransferase
MRIIGGIFRGRLLSTPKGEQTRPTSSLLRKAFFDICSSQLEDTEFLDLFAGSGAMGFEALSRGAKHATFVDKSPLACKTITKNIELLGVQKQSTLLCMPALRALKLLQGKKKCYQLIYIDPPYGKEDPNSLVEEILKGNLLANDGRIFIEELKRNAEDLELKNATLVAKRRYGDTLLLEYEGL